MLVGCRTVTVFWLISNYISAVDQAGYPSVFTARNVCIAHTMSVRPSIRQSHAGILSKRLNISSK